MGEDQVRGPAQQGPGEILEAAPGLLLLPQVQRRGRHPVVDQVQLPAGKAGAEEAQFLQHPVPHGKNPVALPGVLHQGVFVVPVLGAKDLLQVHPLGPGPAQGVVEHHIVARMGLGDQAGSGHLVSVEDGGEAAVPVEQGLVHHPQAHELVGHEKARVLLLRPQRPHPVQAGPSQAQILLVLPTPLVAARFEAEAAVKVVFKIPQPMGRLAHVHQQHLHSHPLPGRVHDPPAVDQAHPPAQLHR